MSTTGTATAGPIIFAFEEWEEEGVGEEVEVEKAVTGEVITMVVRPPFAVLEATEVMRLVCTICDGESVVPVG